MEVMGSKKYDFASQTPEQTLARKRMALFPQNAEVIFVDPELWVPVVRMEGKLCVLPGVPKVRLHISKLETDIGLD
jgi:molybdopterin-biosynthesis enzyme MoeA-like protein